MSSFSEESEAEEDEEEDDAGDDDDDDECRFSKSVNCCAAMDSALKAEDMLHLESDRDLVRRPGLLRAVDLDLREAVVLSESEDSLPLASLPELPPLSEGSEFLDSASEAIWGGLPCPAVGECSMGSGGEARCGLSP